MTGLLTQIGLNLTAEILRFMKAGLTHFGPFVSVIMLELKDSKKKCCCFDIRCDSTAVNVG